MMIYAAITAAIFLAGFKASGYFWSARYDKLEAAHATAIAEQRQRLLTRQELINESTEQRELTLLREIEIQREAHALLQSEINETPLVTERVVFVDGEPQVCPAAPDIDWATFGRLYDSGSSTRPAAEAVETDSGDAGSESPSDSG